MRRRLNAVTLLVPKASDRKFVEIGLKTIAPVLVFYLQYDFVKHEFWKHKLMDACWTAGVQVNFGRHPLSLSFL